MLLVAVHSGCADWRAAICVCLKLDTPDFVADCCSFSQNSALEWGLFLRSSPGLLLNCWIGAEICFSCCARQLSGFGAGAAAEVSSLLPHQLFRVIFLSLKELSPCSAAQGSLWWALCSASSDARGVRAEEQLLPCPWAWLWWILCPLALPGLPRAGQCPDAPCASSSGRSAQLWGAALHFVYPENGEVYPPSLLCIDQFAFQELQGGTEGNAVAALGIPWLGSPPDPVLGQPLLPSPSSPEHCLCPGCAQQGWSPAHSSRVDGFTFSWRLGGLRFVFGLVKNFKEREVTWLNQCPSSQPFFAPISDHSLQLGTCQVSV